MKKSVTVLLLFAAIAILAFSCHTIMIGNGIIGDGNIITSKRITPDFNGIRLQCNAEVRIHSDTNYRISITADSNIECLIETKVVDHILVISIRPQQKLKYNTIIVDVGLPEIHAAYITGSGNIVFVDRLITPSLEASITGSGEIKGDITCHKLNASISGSGEIKLTGNSKHTAISIAGSGDFEGYDLITQTVSVNISGSGKVRTTAEKKLTVNISGSGKVLYHGRPEVSFQSAGSGSVTPVN
jgi:hypothetical protein